MPAISPVAATSPPNLKLSRRAHKRALYNNRKSYTGNFLDDLLGKTPEMRASKKMSLQPPCPQAPPCKVLFKTMEETTNTPEDLSGSPKRKLKELTPPIEMDCSSPKLDLINLDPDSESQELYHLQAKRRGQRGQQFRRHSQARLGDLPVPRKLFFSREP